MPRQITTTLFGADRETEPETGSSRWRLYTCGGDLVTDTEVDGLDDEIAALLNRPEDWRGREIELLLSLYDGRVIGLEKD